MHMNRAFAAWTVALACLVALALPAWPQDAREYRLDIERQPLKRALEAFWEQTGLQYGGLGIRISEKVVGPLRGQYTAEAALRALLKGTGLTFTQANDSTITLLVEASVPKPAGAGVVAEQRPPVEQPRMVVRSARADPEAPAGLLDEMIVTGTRVRADRPPARATLRILHETQIEDLGAATVADLLRHITQQPYLLSESARPDGAQFVSLRGLGSDTTLILIDGRRVLPTASTVTYNSFDVNTIPLAAVERIEVLADSAAAVYGADAIGGVINFILKDRIAEPRLDLDYGTADGGASERHASLSAGGGAGRANASLVLDFFDRGALLGAERERWRDQDFRRFGSTDWRSPNADPGNVMNLAPGDLPGLPSTFAAVPRGSSGMGLTPADFLETAGERNLESSYRYWSIAPERRRTSAIGRIDVSLGLATEAFLDLLYRDEQLSFQFEPPALSGAVVPAESAVNPFGVPVRVSRLLTSLGPRQITGHSRLLRSVAGLRGERDAWNWELSLVHSSDDYRLRVRNELDSARVRAALESSDPEHALNPFRDGPAGSPELLASLLAEPGRGQMVSEGTQMLGFLRGPLFALPAGEATLVAGGEWRLEEMEYAIGPLLGRTLPIAGAHDRSVRATFAELQLPLVNASMSVDMVRELTFRLAARLDRYETLGSTFNPQYELHWRPLQDVALYAVLAQGFRPPSLFDLHAPQIVFESQVKDPRRNGEVAAVALIAGGNPSLRAPDTDAVTAGIALERPDLADLKLAAAYWRIEMNDRVAVAPAGGFLSHEERYAERITRAEPSAADVALGLPGRLQSIDVTRLNFGTLETDGVDISASASLQTAFGRIAPRLSATWVREFRSMEVLGAPAVDRVDLSVPVGTIPRWRVVADLSWRRHGVGVNVAARHTPSYDDAINFQRTGRAIPAQTLIDVQVAVDFDERLGAQHFLEGFELRVGATNLFGEPPPFAQSGLQAGYDVSQGELKERFGYLRLSKRF